MHVMSEGTKESTLSLLKGEDVDPFGKDPHEPGAKLDAGKVQVLRFVLRYFPRAIKAVAGVSEYGAAKYTEMGWASVPDGVNRYSEALQRHLVAAYEEGALDESGLLHRAQVAWNALAQLELYLQEQA